MIKRRQGAYAGVMNRPRFAIALPSEATPITETRIVFEERRETTCCRRESEYSRQEKCSLGESYIDSAGVLLHVTLFTCAIMDLVFCVLAMVVFIFFLTRTCKEDPEVNSTNAIP